MNGFAQSEKTVDNPFTHDPVLAKQGDTYYLFATGQGVSVMSSKDLKRWKFEKPVFAEAPQWAVEAIDGYRRRIVSSVLFLFGFCQEYFRHRPCH